LASIIAHAAVDGDELELIDFNLFFMLLIDAGGDTTRNLVAGVLDALFAHPDQLAWLIEDLSLTAGLPGSDPDRYHGGGPVRSAAGRHGGGS
jgi:cytochrome P450